MTGDETRALYAAAMKEARRVLKLGGTVWVKTKDGIEGGRPRRRFIEVYDAALALGFADRALFIVKTGAPNLGRSNGQQRHPLMNHSFLWIFERQDEARIARAGTAS
jgi:hypothetical protein